VGKIGLEEVCKFLNSLRNFEQRMGRVGAAYNNRSGRVEHHKNHIFEGTAYASRRAGSENNSTFQMQLRLDNSMPKNAKTVRQPGVERVLELTGDTSGGRGG
jgi:hypothetical protein